MQKPDLIYSQGTISRVFNLSISTTSVIYSVACLGSWQGRVEGMISGHFYILMQCKLNLLGVQEQVAQWKEVLVLSVAVFLQLSLTCRWLLPVKSVQLSCINALMTSLDTPARSVNVGVEFGVNYSCRFFLCIGLSFTFHFVVLF